MDYIIQPDDRNTLLLMILLEKKTSTDDFLESSVWMDAELYWNFNHRGRFSNRVHLRDTL
jgi:hypothetical protein